MATPARKIKRETALSVVPPETLQEALAVICDEGASSPDEAVREAVKRYGIDWCRQQAADAWEDIASVWAVDAFNRAAWRARQAARTEATAKVKTTTRTKASPGLLETRVAVPADGSFEYVKVGDLTRSNLIALAEYRERLAGTHMQIATEYRAIASLMEQRGVRKVRGLKLTANELLALVEEVPAT